VGTRKTSGLLILVVPDEYLYEQGIWPSIFNGDHKATFRLDKSDSWSPVSYNIKTLIMQLGNAEVISAEIQNQGYRYSIQSHPGDKTFNYRRLARYYGIMRRLPILGIGMIKIIQTLLFKFHVPADQTWGSAVAQIQVLARKLP